MASARNIGASKQTSRLRAGVIAFAVAQTFAFGLSHLHAARGVRGTLFVPFFVACFCLAQGLTGTDPLLAARGLRDMGDGPEPIAGPSELARVRAAAARITQISLVIAAAATALLVLTAE